MYTSLTYPLKLSNLATLSFWEEERTIFGGRVGWFWRSSWRGRADCICVADGSLMLNHLSSEFRLTVENFSRAFLCLKRLAVPFEYLRGLTYVERDIKNTTIPAIWILGGVGFIFCFWDSAPVKISQKLWHIRIKTETCYLIRVNKMVTIV